MKLRDYKGYEITVDTDGVFLVDMRGMGCFRDSTLANLKATIDREIAHKIRKEPRKILIPIDFLFGQIFSGEYAIAEITEYAGRGFSGKEEYWLFLNGEHVRKDDALFFADTNVNMAKFGALKMVWSEIGRLLGEQERLAKELAKPDLSLFKGGVI